MKQIRFGIMCQGSTFQAWQADAIKKLLELPNVSVALLIVDARTNTDSRWSNLKRLKFKHYLWHYFQGRIWKRSRALQAISLKNELVDARRIECVVEQRGKFSLYFTDEDVEAIRSHQLDFILRFGFGIIRGAILESAAYGIWSFHHDDELRYRGGPPCFWEIVKKDPVTGAILQQLNNKLDAGRILKKGYFRTLPTYTTNRDNVYFASSEWPAAVCSDIQRGVTQVFQEPPSGTNAPIFKQPGNWQTLLYLLGLPYRVIKVKYKGIFVEDHWNIGVAHTPIASFLGDPKPKITWYPLAKRADRFYADPFAYADEKDASKLHIFVETYTYKERKGFLEHIEYQDGQYSTPRPVLKLDTHLSYPYIFDWKGERWVVPENYASGKTEAYRITYPDNEMRDCVSVHPKLGLIDPTIIRHDNKLWLFACNPNDGLDRNQKLHLYYSDDLEGPWHAHPQNPIKRDVRSSRPAGTPFKHEGAIYRPSMDYSLKYQWRIQINRIDVLNENEYQETMVKTIAPFKDTYYHDKTHTLSSAGSFTLVDGAKEINLLTNWHFLLFKLKKKLSNQGFAR